ncbi:hypothetical protein JCM10213_006140 [Rhodosporidiobolus nylandii]
MSSQDLQPCLVCVKGTKQNCAKCAAAGLQIPFCSRECQKMVWFAHKRICGSTKLPLLTKEEADDAKRNRRVPAMYYSEGREGPFSLEGMFQRFMRVYVGRDIGPIIDAVTEGTARPNKMSNVTLFMIRGTRWQREHIANRPHHAVFDVLGNFELLLSNAIADPQVLLGTAPYLPLLRHRAIVVFALNETLQKNLLPSPQLNITTLPQAYDWLCRWIDVDLARLYSPVVAKQVREVMDRSFGLEKVD